MRLCFGGTDEQHFLCAVPGLSGLGGYSAAGAAAFRSGDGAVTEQGRQGLRRSVLHQGPVHLRR